MARNVPCFVRRAMHFMLGTNEEIRYANHTFRGMMSIFRLLPEVPRHPISVHYNDQASYMYVVNEI